MWTQCGPVVTALASFGVGVVASVVRSILLGNPGAVALLGIADEHGRPSAPPHRVATFAGFLLGMATLFTPLGAVAGLSGQISGYAVWSTAGTACVVLLCTTCAAAILGAFPRAFPASLAQKLPALGGDGVRGAFALGLGVALLGAPATLPFALGLATAALRDGHAWLGALSLFAFALGLGSSSLALGVTSLRLPELGRWKAFFLWACSLGLAYLGFTHLRDGSYAMRDFSKNPSYWFGLASGVLFAIGIALGVLHVFAVGRRARLLLLASALPAVVGCSLFVSWLPQPHGNAPPITFVTDEEVGRARATAEHKPVVIVFNATWCCREVEQNMFPDPRVREEAKRFVAIAVDASNDESSETSRLQAKYQVVGIPTIILIDRDEREVTRFNSVVVPPEELANAMRSVR